MAAIIGQAELMCWPGGFAGTFNNFSLNQTTDQWEVIFQVPEDMVITRVGYRQQSITGTAPAYIASLQGVDASGHPDGTIKGGGTPASVVFTPTSGMNGTFNWITLDYSYSASRGEILAFIIAYSSGTIDTSNLVTFNTTNGITISPSRPYTITNDNGVRTRLTTCSVFGVGASPSGVYGLPINLCSSISYNANSTPDERALLLNIPSTVCATYKIKGVAWYGTTPAGQTYTLTLYDTDGTTVLQQVQVDTDQEGSLVANRRREIYFDDVPVTLNAGSDYRISLMSDTASNVALNNVSVLNADEFDCLPYGTGAIGSSRTNAGAWTDNALQRYAINPILADMTAPTGGGGGTVGYGWAG